MVLSSNGLGCNRFCVRAIHNYEKSNLFFVYWKNDFYCCQQAHDAEERNRYS